MFLILMVLCNVAKVYLHKVFGIEHGSRVASSYQTLEFFVCFTYYFAVFCTGCLHSYCLRQTHTFRNRLLRRTSETGL